MNNIWGKPFNECHRAFTFRLPCWVVLQTLDKRTSDMIIFKCSLMEMFYEDILVCEKKMSGLYEKILGIGNLKFSRYDTISIFP